MSDSNFEVGEEAFIDSTRYGQIILTPAVVKRLTKTQAVVEVNGIERKFQQDGGRQYPRASEWSPDSYLRHGDDEHLQRKLREQEKRSKLFDLTKVAESHLRGNLSAEKVIAAFNAWNGYDVEGAK